MEILAIVGVIFATGLIIYLSLKGVNILVISPLCALIVMLTNRMPILDSLLKGPTSYMGGLSGFVASFFIIFLLGSVLAKYIEESGAANSIANGILKLTGTEKPYSVLVAIFLMSLLLTYGGVSLFVVLFAVVPLARNLFEKLNIPWRLIITPYFLGVATVTMTMMPGTPAIQNVIPTMTLGTTLTAAPMLGIVASIVVTIWGLWCMKRELKTALNNGETFDPKYSKKEDQKEQKNSPNLFLSLLPLVTLIVIIFVGSFLKIGNIIIPALTVSIIVSGLAFHRYIDSHKQVLNLGATGAISPTIFSASAVGFGSVVASAAGFQTILAGIQSIPGNPLISLSVLTGAMAGVTGSSSGALGIVMNNFVQPYVDMGIDPAIIHRMSAIASGVLTCLPQCGALLSMYALTGLTHKETYKNLFISVVVGSFIAFIAAFILAVLF
ncbi:cytochrome C biogenesis protein CcmE [Enterococcus silesiacus]|uniref:Cytochrome C biogenesis protein CcmE n=1 Tax=Enterococcus silesiacus TaxID=332949 RepID=A0A0S3KBX1_9ENTE|nr:GntP family permease [Enterococcus silesiacus]ALS01808.1 cytochrome C biogenesis protein CcmE [Enterococcus silesiacus]OJG92067.1 H+ symporter [Enterococcus silesiacus]